MNSKKQTNLSEKQVAGHKKHDFLDVQTKGQEEKYDAK
jgi:hypothetical protein